MVLKDVIEQNLIQASHRIKVFFWKPRDGENSYIRYTDPKPARMSLNLSLSHARCPRLFY